MLLLFILSFISGRFLHFDYICPFNYLDKPTKLPLVKVSLDKVLTLTSNFSILTVWIVSVIVSLSPSSSRLYKHVFHAPMLPMLFVAHPSQYCQRICKFLHHINGKVYKYRVVFYLICGLDLCLRFNIGLHVGWRKWGILILCERHFSRWQIICWANLFPKTFKINISWRKLYLGLDVHG